MTSLTELSALLDAATGASRELDAAIAKALLLTPDGYTPSRIEGFWNAPASAPQPGPSWWTPGPYTSSIDAALALVERMLPGWDWRIERVRPQHYRGMVWAAGYQDATLVRSYAATAPLAILKALVIVLIDKELHHE